MVKESVKSKTEKKTGLKHPGNLGHYGKAKSMNNGNFGEETQVKGAENIFNKIIEENFHKLKEMPIRVKGTNRTPNKLHQKRNFLLHIIMKTPPGGGGTGL